MPDPGAPSGAVAEITFTAGTGPYQLNPTPPHALAAYFRFADVYPAGGPVTVEVDDTAQKEIVTGTFDTASNTISRDQVLYSSNGNALIDWPDRGQRTVRPLTPPFPLCPTPPVDGQVLVWSAAEKAYCPADLCALVLACLSGSMDFCTLVSACLMPTPTPPTLPTLPIIDGTAESLADFVTVSTITLSTTQPNDLIWVHVATLDASVIAGGTGNMMPPRVTGITDTAGLSWQRRASPAFFASGIQPPNAASVENWWARSPDVLTNDVITVSVDGMAANLNMLAFGMSGITLVGSPFDPNPSLPADSGDPTSSLTQPEVTVSTTNPATVLIMSTDQQAENGLGSMRAGSSGTLIRWTGQTHVGGDLVGGLSYRILQSPQTNLVVQTGAPSNVWVARADALIVA